MNNEKMREEFQVWFAENYPKMDREETAQDCLFKMIAAQAWEQSRAAIEVELPKKWPVESACDECANEMREQCISALEYNFGISVKQ